MKDWLKIDELRSMQRDIGYAISMMEQCQAQHPTAKVSYELATKRVNISYPLPSDFDPKKTKAFLEEVTFKNL